MSIVKLIALVALVKVVEGESLITADVIDHDLFSRAHEIHKVFLLKEEVEPTQHYRYGYEITDPNTAILTSQYEIRYNDVNMGIYTAVGTREGHRSTVHYTLDATGYHATLSEDSQQHNHLDYAHFPSPLVSSTPAHNEDTGAFTSFLIDDKENIEKHSPEARSAHYTHCTFTEYFNISVTQDCIWGYEVDGNRSQYATHRGGNIEGRITLVSADGCVSSMDYTVDANHFNVSTVRRFGKQDIAQLYLEPEHYPLLLQIARGPSTCAV